MTTTDDDARERILRAEQRALICECEKLQAQLTAHNARLTQIRRLLIVKPIAKKQEER